MRTAILFILSLLLLFPIAEINAVSNCCKAPIQGPPGPRGPQGPQGPSGESSEDPPFTDTQILWVDKGGNDATGNGSDEKPFLTISHAMSVITDASSAKRYTILVGPGTYAEDVILKANVFITGFAPILTRVNSISIDDPSWTVDDDNRSGLQSIQVLGNTTIDFVQVQSHQGKVYIFQCRLSGDLLFTACNSINEVLLYNCELQSSLVHQGGDVLWFSSTIFGDITIFDQISDVNPIPGQLIDTRFFGSGGGNLLPLDSSGFLPAFTVSNTVVSPSPIVHNIQVDLAGFAVSGTLTIIGGGLVGDTIVTATADGVPSTANVSVTGTGVLNLSTFANGIGYTPTTSADWANPQPQTVQEALDRIAAFIGPIPP